MKKAFILTQLLTGMFDETLNSYTSVTGASLQNQLTDIYAGKSGTTDFDSWMIGYSPVISTGIWVGYDDHREMTNVAEAAFSKEIWANYMENIDEDGKNVFPMPSGVVGLPIDPVSGLRADTSCEKAESCFMKKGPSRLDTVITEMSISGMMPSRTRGFLRNGLIRCSKRGKGLPGEVFRDLVQQAFLDQLSAFNRGSNFSNVTVSSC